MKPHVSILLGAWLFACLLITGCGDSTVPLSDASKASPDKRLIGLWQHRHQNGVTYYHVGRLGGKAPEGVMRVVIVSHRAPSVACVSFGRWRAQLLEHR